MMVEMGGGGVCLGRDILTMPGEWRGEPCKYMVKLSTCTYTKEGAI